MSDDIDFIDAWVKGYATGKILITHTGNTYEVQESTKLVHRRSQEVVAQMMLRTKNKMCLFQTSNYSQETVPVGYIMVDLIKKYTNCRLTTSDTMIGGMHTVDMAARIWLGRVHTILYRLREPAISRMHVLHLGNMNALQEIFELPFDTLYPTDTEAQLKEKLDCANALYKLGAIE